MTEIKNQLKKVFDLSDREADIFLSRFMKLKFRKGEVFIEAGKDTIQSLFSCILVSAALKVE